MGCCGRGSLARAGAAPQRGMARALGQPQAPSAGPPRQSRPVYEYVGRTALTAVGAVTGARYRFDRLGARLAVEPADKPSIAAVPLLRRVFN